MDFDNKLTLKLIPSISSKKFMDKFHEKIKIINYKELNVIDKNLKLYDDLESIDLSNVEIKTWLFLINSKINNYDE